MANLIELLATASDKTVRNPQRALDLIREAMELVPQERRSLGLGHRGIARYQIGAYPEAKADLQKWLDLPGGTTPGALEMRAGVIFFLAMAHWRLDEKDEACTCFKNAMELLKKHGGRHDKWENFPAIKETCAEAARLLGMDKKD